MSYTHFTQKEIIAIEIYKKEWLNKNQIWKKLGRNHTSIWRIIAKYSDENWKFSAEYCISERKKIQSKKNSKNKERIKKWSDLEKFILIKIKEYFSPDQIAWRWNTETKEKISKDTIYKYIYENYPELIKPFFRRKWKKYQNKRKEKYQIDDRKMIELRNEKYWEKISKKSEIWHWEWDTIIWVKWWSKEVILTNVERKSWYLLATKIKNKSWEAVLNWTLKLFKDIDENKKISMIYDNWREFCLHRMIEYLTKFDVYFAHPYSSRERWINENTNWLIRQFLPKKTDFNTISEKDLQKFVKLINFRPRKRLNYKTPFEVFFNVNLIMCTSF